MARLKFGPWGGIIGRLGNHIGYFRKGKAVLRMISFKTRKKRTVRQKSTTQRFGLIIKFMPAVNQFTNIGFGIAAQGNTKTAQNLAVSYNIKNAITGEYPDQEIDYSKIRLSEGKLILPDNIYADAMIDGNKIILTFRWDVQSDERFDVQQQRAMILAYSPELGQAYYDESGTKRSLCEARLIFPIEKDSHYNLKKPNYVETYITFISADSKSISDSLYTGRVDIVYS